MDNFNNANATAQPDAESTLPETRRTRECVTDTLDDNDCDGGDELSTEGSEASRLTLDLVNRELADIALAEAALAICQNETFNGEWLKEQAEGRLNNPARGQPPFYSKEGSTSRSTSVSRSHLNILEAVDAVVQFRHFEAHGLVALSNSDLSQRYVRARPFR